LNAGDPLSPWYGIYFMGNPIKIEAIPDQGFRFKQWLGVEATNNPLTLNPDKDIEISAVFEKVD
jgi:hypothetical protein